MVSAARPILEPGSMFATVTTIPTCPAAMRPRPVLRLLAAALVIGLLVACDESGPIAGGTPEEHIQKAQEHRGKGELRAGIIEVKNALQQDVRNVAARFLLGQLYLEMGDAAAAETELVRAAELGADPVDLMEPLGRARLAQGKYFEILDQPVLDVDAPPEIRASASVIRGNAYRGLGRIDEALIELRGAADLDPTNAGAFTGLARIAMEKDDLEQAERDLAGAMAAAPEDFDVLALKGDIEYAKKDYAASEATFQDLVDRRPDNLFPLIPLARAQIAGNRIDEAVANLEKALAVSPNHRSAQYLRALAAHQVKDYKTAGEFSKRVLGLDPNHLPSLMLAGSSSFAEGEFEQAARYLGSYLANVPDNDVARRIYGATLLKLGRGRDAVRTLEPLVDEETDDAELLAMIGAAAVQSRDFRRGRKYFERVAGLKPGDPEALVHLGTIRIGLGDADRGVRELEQAIALDPKLDRAAVTLFAAHLRERRFEQALTVAQGVQKASPDKALGFTMAGIALTSRRDYQAARAAFRKALDVEPGAEDASENLANLEMRGGNPDAAREALLATLEHRPDSVRLMLRLSAIEGGRKNWEESRAWVEKAIAADEGAVAPRVALARLHLREGNAELALDATRGFRQSHPDNPDLLTVVGQAQLLAGQPEDAAVTFRSLVRIEPESVDAHYLLATTYRTLGDGRRLRQEVEKILQIQPDHLPAKLTLVSLLIDQRETERAVPLLAEIKRASGETMRVLDLEGRLAISERRFEDALAILTRAKRKQAQPNRTRTLMLASAQWGAGRHDDALDTIEQWLAGIPDDHATRLTLGTRYLGLGRWEKARDHFAVVVEKVPDNWAARNNLAWTLMKMGETGQALIQAQKALELSEDSPEVMDTAGVVLLELGSVAAALDLLRRAADQRPDSGDILVHLANALVKNGEIDEARDVLNRVLAENLPLSDREEATALLEKVGR